MSQTYVTSSGDTIDSICYKYYGSDNTELVLAVLDANPGACETLVFSYGTELTMPVINSVDDTSESVSLWD